MLRVSKLTDYGTVVMTYLARDPTRVCSANEVATAVRIAVPTVSKLLKLLTQEGLVNSYRGAQGGYSLARDPELISVAQIIRALEGPIAFTECSVTSGLCMQEASCSIRPNWQKINGAIQTALDSVTLADMTQSVAAPIAITPASLADDTASNCC